MMGHPIIEDNPVNSEMTLPENGTIKVDRLEAMSMLVAVTEKGSLSAAGRALQVPLATLSRKISALESQLGTRLLIRTTRKLTLTDAGIAYVAAARRILEEVEEAEREAAGEFHVPKGELVVTAPLMFGRLHVLPVVADFLATYPDISVRLILADRNLDLIDDHVDMAVRIGKLPDSSMVATQIGVMRTVTCASPALVASSGAPKTPDDLPRLPCVNVDAPMPSPSWRFRKPRSNAAIDVLIQPRLTVTTPEAAAQAAVRKVGVVRLLHYQASEAIARGELQILLEAYEPEPVPVHLVHVSRGQMPLKMRRFLDFAAPRLKQATNGIGQLRKRKAS
jgi:DNA-binding transcriptional LysR family regulator